MKRAVLLLVLAVAACGDDGSHHPADGIELDHDDLSCPSDSLVLTKDGGFLHGTAVTFVMSNTVMFDGSAVVLDDGSVTCGLPDNAPAGDYKVLVLEGGTSDPVDAGTVTLDSSTCS